jgi:hypothetical protein
MPDFLPTNEVIAVALSTFQEITNLISIEMALEKYNLTRIDILQTSHAATQGWAKNLQSVLKKKGNFRIRLVPLSELQVTNDYDPFHMSEAIQQYYQNEASIVWCWGGAQKPQSAALLLAFSERRMSRQDAAIYCDIGNLHLTDGTTQQQSKPDIDIEVEEFAELYGIQIDPTKPSPLSVFNPKPTWNFGNPLSKKGPLPVLENFQTDPNFRQQISAWPQGDSLMTNQQFVNNPATVFFEQALLCRVHRFLQKNPNHIVSDVKANIHFAGTGEFDLVIVTKRGTLIALDAKYGKNFKLKYRQQIQSAQRIGGTTTKFFYVVPWFPDYLDKSNCDFAWNPEIHPADKGIQSLVDGWRDIDENFGSVTWPEIRPPDNKTKSEFHKSLCIPFDAGDLFEERLKKLLLQG